MINKKIIAILLIALFVITILPSSLARDDKSYEISNADISLLVNPNGFLSVTQTYTYVFDGKFHGVYRDIPLKNGQSINNLNVTTDGAYSTFKVTHEKDNEHIVVNLYSDEAHTQSIRDTTVNVTYTYNFVNAINIYKDIGELHFVFWSSDWDCDVSKVHTSIHLNSSEGVSHWVNPYFLSNKAKWDGNVLNIDTGRISENNYGEVRVLIPLSQFDSNPQYGNIINENGLQKLKDIQEGYKTQAQLENSILTFIPIILFASLIIPLIIYLREGREPKISYNGIYESEPPTNDSPMFVDAVFSNKKGIGTASDNGYQATIMDLINRKYLILNRNEGDIQLEVNNAKDLSSLESYEVDIINILKRYSGSDVIDFNKIKNNLSNQSFAKDFTGDYSHLLSDYKFFKVKPVLYKYFSNDGSIKMKIYNVIAIIVAIILIVYCLYFSVVPAKFTVFILALLFAIINVALLFLPNRVGGRWTVEGYTKYKQWSNFKKYLTDFSLIKEHPPESIAVWNQYLVYATALGEAKAVLKAMEKFIPDEFNYNDLYYYHNFGGYYLMSHAIRTAHSNANSSNGGFGGIGGGSGGGGGGAF
ncbi:MAG: DUF2207 domain-containing protein [archaeon]|nr:DUF2207 domain-containing protein [archaeon]